MAYELPSKILTTGGRTYKVTVLDARTATDLQQTLAHMASHGFMGGATPGQMMAAAFAGRIRLSTDIYDVLFSTVMVDNIPLDAKSWPYHFAGKPLELLEVGLFALQTNFEGFIDGLPQLLERYAPVIEDESEPEPD